MNMHLQPPGFLFMHTGRASPMTTLLKKFSMLWKLKHIMLMKIHQDHDILSGLFWHGYYAEPMYCGFAFLTQLPRLRLSLFVKSI